MLDRLRAAVASHWVRAFLALALVVIAPAGLVWLSAPYEYTVAWRLGRDLERAHAEIDAALDARSGRDAFERIARRYAARVRVHVPSRGVIQDHDFSLGGSLEDLYGELGFTAQDRAAIQDYDDELGPLPQRREVREALADAAPRQGCELGAGRRLLVCHDVRLHQTPQGRGVLVHAQATSPRSIRSLYTSRYQLLALATQVAVVALLLGGWLGVRIVRPMNVLRRQVHERTRAPVSTEPVDVPSGRDEAAALARSFNELLEALEDGRQANLGFMADVAHELKNPIAAVRACAERLERGEPIDEARAARMGRAMRSASERMHQMIDQFLALARAEAGLHDERRERFDLAELVGRLVAIFEADERYRRVRFGVEVAPAQVIGAPVHLETAARNLLENAASLVDPEGGRVWVRVGERGGEEVFLEVEDDGPGISAEELPRIFERFYTRRVDDSGTGLGLAMTRAIVRAHGGRIEVDSELGEGTTIRVGLPRAPEEGEVRS